jgi:hypothetical protein
VTRDLARQRRPRKTAATSPWRQVLGLPGRLVSRVAGPADRNVPGPAVVGAMRGSAPRAGIGIRKKAAAGNGGASSSWGVNWSVALWYC